MTLDLRLPKRLSDKKDLTHLCNKMDVYGMPQNRPYIETVKTMTCRMPGGGGGYSPNMVNGGVPLKWVTFFQEIPKHGVWFCAGKSLNMPPPPPHTFVILL